MTVRKVLGVLGLLVGLSVIGCQQTDPEQQAAEVVEEPVMLTAEERLAGVQSELKGLKAELTTKGDYNCCVQPACDWCLLHEGNCACYDNLKAKKEVCPGCGLGWHNGQGVVKGVKASQVKWNITHEHAKGATHAH